MPDVSGPGKKVDTRTTKAEPGKKFDKVEEDVNQRRDKKGPQTWIRLIKHGSAITQKKNIILVVIQSR